MPGTFVVLWLQHPFLLMDPAPKRMVSIRYDEFQRRQRADVLGMSSLCGAEVWAGLARIWNRVI